MPPISLACGWSAVLKDDTPENREKASKFLHEHHDASLKYIKLSGYTIKTRVKYSFAPTPGGTIAKWSQDFDRAHIARVNDFFPGSVEE